MGLLDLPPQVTVALTIKLHDNGALSVEGPVHDKAFCLALLQNAIDAVRNFRKPGLVVPQRDVQMPEQKVPLVS